MSSGPPPPEPTSAPSPTPLSEVERAHWVLLNSVTGVGPVRFQRIVDLCGSAEAAWGASEFEFAAAGFDRRTIAALRALRRTADAADVPRELARRELQALALPDIAYPTALRQIADPPPVLYVRGTLAPDAPSIGIVGTRRTTSYGRTVAEQFAGELVRAGVTVVSGLARGVDTAAHRGALDAGGATVAVLGNGLDQVYPPENGVLARRIVESGRGAVISEFTPGVPPDAANFPRRNRIIAGLSAGVVIVEAGERSGALITADFALEQGRDVFAVPGSILSPMSAGPNNLLKQGAAPATSAQDVLDALGFAASPGLEARVVQELPTDEAAVFAALSTEPLAVDALTRTTGLDSGAVAAALTMLELKGLARHAGGMTYRQA